MNCSLPFLLEVYSLEKSCAKAVALFQQHLCPLVAGTSNPSDVAPCGRIKAAWYERQLPDWVTFRRPCYAAKKKQLCLKQLPAQLNLAGLLQHLRIRNTGYERGLDA